MLLMIFFWGREPRKIKMINNKQEIFTVPEIHRINYFAERFRRSKIYII